MPWYPATSCTRSMQHASAGTRPTQLSQSLWPLSPQESSRPPPQILCNLRSYIDWRINPRKIPQPIYHVVCWCIFTLKLLSVGLGRHSLSLHSDGLIHLRQRGPHRHICQPSLVNCHDHSCRLSLGWTSLPLPTTRRLPRPSSPMCSFFENNKNWC